MTCCITSCGRKAVVLVRFQYVRSPYAYCDMHGYRRGRLIWKRGVRHVQEIDR